MSKKDFIALGSVVRDLKPNMQALTGGPNDLYLQGRMAEWEIMLNRLADFCAQANPRFNRTLWISFVNGECGPSGGKVNPAKGGK